MDLTFSRFFSPSNADSFPSESTQSKTRKKSKKEAPLDSDTFSKTAANHQVKSVSARTHDRHLTQQRLGENHMLSHRNEVKNEETTSYPKSVDNARSFQSSAPEKASPKATIGPKIRFKGELVGEEDLLVHGTVEGTIDLKGHNLIVGEQGVLQANVSAKTVTIEGRVEGDVFGEERITIRSSSNVQGNIKAERVVLEDGAKFRGSIDMDVSTPAQASKPATSPEAKSAKPNPAAPNVNQPPKP